MFNMEGIDVSDDEQNDTEPGIRIDRQSLEGTDDSDQSGESHSSSGETDGADSEDEPEEDDEAQEGAEEVDGTVGTTAVPGSTASTLSSSMSSPSMVMSRLGILSAFKHSSSGDFFQGLGRRSEERTPQGSEMREPFLLSPQPEVFEVPEIQQSDDEFSGQQQQQRQYALPSAEVERAAAVDQELLDDTLLQAHSETMPETDAAADQNLRHDTPPQVVLGAFQETVDKNYREDSLPHADSKKLHEEFLEDGDRPLLETTQSMEANILIDEGVIYEAEKFNTSMDISHSFAVAHHPQAQEEETLRSEIVQESRVLTDFEDPSELWKGDPLQKLDPEISMLELTLSPLIKPYRVLRRPSSEEEFVDALPPPKARMTENTTSTSSLATKETQGFKHLPVATPMARRMDTDHANNSSGGDGGGGGQLGYELLYPRFASLKSNLAAASARVVSFSLLHRSDSASSPSVSASADDVGIQQASTKTGTQQVQQETSALHSTASSSSSSSPPSQLISTATTSTTTATLATELGHLQTSVSSLHQRLDRIEQALDISSSGRRTDLRRRTMFGIVRMVVKQGVISAVIILVVFVVLYRRRSPVAMVVLAQLQRQLRVVLGIDGAVQQGGGGGGWKLGAGSGRLGRWRTLIARVL
ncbi:hypothetical protein EC968_005018 [Mortierella alpina]|nr:hypothetical protein EC968_005018 [Mortierella alpina]